MRLDRRRNKLSHSHEVEGGRGPAGHEDVEDDHKHVQIRIGGEGDLQLFDFNLWMKYLSINKNIIQLIKKTHPKAATDKLKRKVAFNYVNPLSCIYHQSSGNRLSQPDGHIVAEGDDVLLSPLLFQPLLTGSCSRNHLSLPI